MVSKEELSDWFIGKAKNASRSASSQRKAITTHAERSRSRTVIGKMFFFWYDPKHKLTLPMYDRFPLVLPIEHYGDGFLGLNLHYLNQGNRVVLLSKLMEFANNKRYDESTRLRLSYQLLKATTAMDLAQPCIHRYLFEHVRSRFIEVEANEWEKAIALPVELFVVKK